MRPQHTGYVLEGFPIYSSSFVSPSRLILGGGGGQTRSGVRNKLRLYDVTLEALNLVHEYEFEAGSDAPMSIAAAVPPAPVEVTSQPPLNVTFACGANASEDAMKRGENMHCRLFSIKYDKIVHVKSVKAMEEMKGDAYQKVSVLSPAQDVLAVGTTSNEVHLLHYPSLARAAPVIGASAGELFDISFSATSVAIASSTNIFIYNLHEDKAPSENMLKAKNAGSVASLDEKTPEKGKGKGKGKNKANGKASISEKMEAQLESLELASTIVRPKLPSVGAANSTFRAVRYHPNDFFTLYAVLNTTTKTSSSYKRRAYVVIYSWIPKLRAWSVVKSRRISEGSLTCFEISSDGHYLAYAASDCSIGILNAKTLAPLQQILNAHEFPATTLRFNTDHTLLVSASADSSVRIVNVPEGLESRGASRVWVLFIALLAVLLALLAELYRRRQLLTNP
ncbi:hypothetical protein M408DRAFT_333251 [Serendipita vermifera MAFF 305830]|uniref:Uncharacterized protein n=1 Tax=Serendipita vermifera MAFF 305830 TaxID=933852 RepID=A0A0C3AP24_SERVB|nr:hypothetical protein M408DRAFT_333251 [Serendipita vermifera MAFF 305830]